MEESLGGMEVGTFQGHRFGPGSAKGPLYLDVMLPGFRWAVRIHGWENEHIVYPRTNTWRAAYGLKRRFEGKTSR
jgi:hypothetical protein